MTRRFTSWVCWLLALGGAEAARAEAPLAQPLFVHLPGASGEQPVRDRFSAACRRAGLLPLLSIDLDPPAPPRAPVALRAGAAAIDELRFADAVRELDGAANDVALSCAAGLSTADLADIHLLRARALGRLSPPDDRRAWDDLTQAATLAPERILDEGRFSPTLMDAWRRAVADVQRRPRGTLVVRAPLGATISIDGRPAVRAPAVTPGIPYGQHHLRVEEVGRVSWSAVVPVGSPTVELDVPPRAALALDDRAAAARARLAGARFALTGTLRFREGSPLYELRLIDAASALRRGEMLVDAAEPSALEQAIERLVAEPPSPAARRWAPLPTADLQSHPARGWWTAGRAGWLVAGVVTVGAVVAAVLLTHRDSAGPGFAVGFDPSCLGQPHCGP
jgi:PEGA domain-containing protein